MASWSDGIKDCNDVVNELIKEYTDLYQNQQARIKAGLATHRLAIDYNLAISALERVKDCLKELQPPESKVSDINGPMP